MKRISLFDVFWLTYPCKRDNYIYCCKCFNNNFKSDEEKIQAILYLICIKLNVPQFYNNYGLYAPKMSDYFKRRFYKNEIYLKIFEDWKKELEENIEEQAPIIDLKEFGLDL